MIEFKQSCIGYIEDDLEEGMCIHFCDGICGFFLNQKCDDVIEPVAHSEQKGGGS